ncbi:MAG: GAF domain-containing protein [Gammaproteobacteria bacterium]|nr:GAF domain-containing protein [Gammaproteobacteria bacterium]
MSNHFPVPDFSDKAAGYRELDAQLAALLSGEHDLIANTANAAALLYGALPDLNWAGFYLLRPSAGAGSGAGGGAQELVLGPFQGKPACVRIALGRGVCGTAAAERRTVLVPDVHAFPGHIACDAASNSEIVVPMIRSARGGAGGVLLGVLDLDSPKLGRFDAVDQAGLERIVATLVASLT